VVLTLLSSDRDGMSEGMVLNRKGKDPENYHEKGLGYYLMHCLAGVVVVLDNYAVLQALTTLIFTLYAVSLPVTGSHERL
jgi:hypothetical protein